MADPIQHIAVLRQDNIGDHVLGSALLPALRGRFPLAHISVLIPENTLPLYRHCPYINSCLALPPWQQYVQGPPERLQDLISSLRRQHHRQFDYLLVPRFAEDYYLSGALVQALAPRVSLGWWQSRQVISGYDANAAYTHLLRADDSFHAAAYGVAMMRHFGVEAAATPCLWYGHNEQQQAIEVAVTAGLASGQPYVALALGAAAAHRRWPLSHWAQFCTQFAALSSLPMVLFGGAAEQSLAAELKQICSTPLIDLCGKLALDQSAALLESACIYVGPDSGPKHLAAAQGVPVLELGFYPPRWPSSARGEFSCGSLWAAFGVPTIRIQPPNTVTDIQIYNGEAIGMLEPERVLRAAFQLMGNGPTQRA